MRADEAALFVSEHGMLPLVRELRLTSSAQAIPALLQSYAIAAVNPVQSRLQPYVIEAATLFQAIHALLRLLNAILEEASAAVCETACLLGLLPAVLPYSETHHPHSTRLEAARLMHRLCTRSVRSLQILAVHP